MSSRKGMPFLPGVSANQAPGIQTSYGIISQAGNTFTGNAVVWTRNGNTITLQASAVAVSTVTAPITISNPTPAIGSPGVGIAANGTTGTTVVILSGVSSSVSPASLALNATNLVYVTITYIVA